MTGETGPAASQHQAPHGGESLELRAPPRPVTRINRKLLAGVVGLGFALLAGLVLLALNPPSWRSSSVPTELYNVDNKPKSDALTRLPATYEGVGLGKKEPPNGAAVPQLQPGELGDRTDAERGRLAKQAREASPLFRLSLKPVSTEARADELRRPESAARSSALDNNYAGALDRAPRSADGNSSATDATEQIRKLTFLKTGPDKDIYNPHALQRPLSPYQLLAGTVISASLLTGLNADLPGFVIAQVTEPTYDTVSGRNLLIPQGSRLIGKYDSVVAYGQERALVVWQRIIRPDGSSIVIDNLPATDTGGYAGLADAVDLHTWKLLKGVGLATVLGVGSSLAFGSGSGDSDIIRALREATGQTTNRAGQRLIERELNVQPTLTVRPGWPLRVIVHKDIVFR